MTMYLSQANSKTIYTPRFQETRTRRNGKYSHVRTRSCSLFSLRLAKRLVLVSAEIPD